MSNLDALGVIPARYASQRFPGKPLAMIGGKTMIRRVYERTLQAKTLARVIVATDDMRIRDEALSFGAEAIMTSPDAPSGTDRIVEAIGNYEHGIVVNIQGDEPFVDPEGIDDCVSVLRECPEVDVATLAEKIENADQLLDPSVVKVVNDYENNALYFSRSIIPYPRGYESADGDLLVDEVVHKTVFLKHIGLYAYRREALMRFASLPQSPLEMIEKLEQLRFLQAGGKIRILETIHTSVGVDTPEDLAVAEKLVLAYDKPPDA